MDGYAYLPTIRFALACLVADTCLKTAGRNARGALEDTNMLAQALSATLDCSGLNLAGAAGAAPLFQCKGQRAAAGSE